MLMVFYGNLCFSLSSRSVKMASIEQDHSSGFLQRVKKNAQAGQEEPESLAH